MKHSRCRDMLESLSFYVEGEAPSALCSRIERHLAQCPDCRIVVDTLHKTMDMYRRLPRPDMPREARERLYKSLDLSEYLD
jgi:predicted anti-sigma-YlaC factor YlaD